MVFDQLPPFLLDRGLKLGFLTVIKAVLFRTEPVNANPGLKAHQSIDFSCV